MHFSPQCSSSSTRFFSARHTSAHVEPSPTGTRKLICSRFVAQLHLRFSLYPAERFPDILQAILSHRDSKAARESNSVRDFRLLGGVDHR